MNKVFITGATGFIGHRLANTLAKDGHTVHALIRKQNDAALFEHPNIKLFYGDITYPKTIREAIKDCNYAYHVAGYTKLWAKDPSVFYKVNVKGTGNVLQEALEAGVKKLVYTSSTAVFGPSLNLPTSEKDPRIISFKNDYDLSKHLAEKLVKEYCQKGLYSVIVNPSRVYGPGLLSSSNAISRLLLDSLRGKLVFIPRAKNVVSNYAFIDDVVDGHIKAMYKGISGEKYILGGENIPFDELVDVVKKHIKNIRLIPLSLSAMKVLGYIELALNRINGKEPLITPGNATKFYLNSSFSSQKAVRRLDYSITPFSKGIKQTIDYVNHLYNNNAQWKTKHIPSSPAPVVV